jgi:hypothetical protein
MNPEANFGLNQDPKEDQLKVTIQTNIKSMSIRSGRFNSIFRDRWMIHERKERL